MKVTVICQLFLAFHGNDWRPGEARYVETQAPKCYSENDIIPEELQADDATSKSLAAKINEFVKKMEAP